MTEIAFYHLGKSPLEQVLPKLLEKTLGAGKRALVLAGSEQRVEALAGLLWTYEQGSWLPPGTAQDGSPADQPVGPATGDGRTTAWPLALCRLILGIRLRFLGIVRPRDLKTSSTTRFLWPSSRTARRRQVR